MRITISKINEVLAYVGSDRICVDISRVMLPIDLCWVVLGVSKSLD